MISDIPGTWWCHWDRTDERTPLQRRNVPTSYHTPRRVNEVMIAESLRNKQQIGKRGRRTGKEGGNPPAERASAYVVVGLFYSSVTQQRCGEPQRRSSLVALSILAGGNCGAAASAACEKFAHQPRKRVTSPLRTAPAGSERDKPVGEDASGETLIISGGTGGTPWDERRLRSHDENAPNAASAVVVKPQRRSPRASGTAACVVCISVASAAVFALAAQLVAMRVFRNTLKA